MVERLLRMLNREWSGLHEAAFLLAGTALLSQVLGLLRDRILTGMFGAGETLDVYYAAFRVPDFLYASVASFVAVTVLIPFFFERMEKNGGREEARRFMSSIAVWFLLGIGLSIAAAWALLPTLAAVVVPGLSEASRDEFIALSRPLLLSPLLLGLSNLLGTMTQSLRRFAVFALGPVLYNLGILFGAIVLLPFFGLMGLVWGVIAGALLHLLVQIPPLARESLLPIPVSFPRIADIVAVVRLSIPRTLALSATHFSGIVLVAIASTINEGSIAVFMLAMNLQNIPLTLVGMSYSVAAFPTLAKLWTEGDRGMFLGNITNAARHIIFWSFPAIVLFIVLRAQIVRTLYGVGAFDWTATRLTAALLALFAFSIVAQNLVLLCTRAFYAMGRTRTPLIANVIGAVAQIGFVLLLLFIFNASPLFRYFIESLLRVPDIPGTAVLMLALGYSLGILLNVTLLLIALRRIFSEFLSLLKRVFLHSFTSAVWMGFVAYLGLQAFSRVLDAQTVIGIFLQGLFSGAIGIIAGIFLLKLMDNRELEEIRAALRRKFWKAEAIVAEQEGL